MLRLERRCGGSHGGAGRQPIIDQDHSLAADVKRRAIIAVGPLPAGELVLLVGRYDRDDSVGYTQRLDDVIAEHPDAAGGNSAHGQLFMARHAEFADQHHVKRCVQCSGYLESNRYPTARQCEHEQVGPSGIGRERGSEPASGMVAVGESRTHHSTPRISSRRMHTAAAL